MMITEIEPGKFYRPAVIADHGWIVSSTGRKSYKFILRLIRAGKLKADNVALGTTPYYLVTGQEILRYRKETYRSLDQ